MAAENPCDSDLHLEAAAENPCNAAVEQQPITLDSREAPRHEGLHTALEYLDEHTRTVLIIDDNPDDALLIRRFLEARKAYRVFTARHSQDGLAQARQRLPDLIVLDLMMPEMDGFGVLEELKYDQRTRRIPVIVVSAKDITLQDRQRLNGHITAIYQKGKLPPGEFVEQVVEVLKSETKSSIDHFNR
jgi:threonine synthase